MASLMSNIIMLNECFHACAGLVFFAFAFNMVDCGGILGGRLGNNVNMHAASLKKAKVRFACT